MQPLVHLVRELFGSPLDATQQMAPTRGDTPLVRGKRSDDPSEMRRKLKEYEGRLTAMHALANKQAADITELRTAAETQLTHAVRRNQALIKNQCISPSADGTAPPASTSASTASPQSGEDIKALLEDAAAQQQSALEQGRQQLRELASTLQAQQQLHAERQTSEWRHLLHEASETHTRVVSQVMAA